MQREFELVSNDLSGLDEEDLRGELLELAEAQQEKLKPSESNTDQVPQ